MFVSDLTSLIRKNLKSSENENSIRDVSLISPHLSDDGTRTISTREYFIAEDRDSRIYRITVEEI